MSESPAEKLAGAKPSAEKRGPHYLTVNCRKFRQELRLTLEDVGQAAGISMTTVCRIEAGDDPLLSTAKKLAKFFGKTVDEIWPTQSLDSPSASPA